MGVGQVDLMVADDGQVLVVEQHELLNGDDYDRDRQAFDVWEQRPRPLWWGAPRPLPSVPAKPAHRRRYSRG